MNVPHAHSAVHVDHASIKRSEMTAEMLQAAVDVSAVALARYNLEKHIAGHIKNEFDLRYGATWHCIVGRNFGSLVSHETGHFAYFYIGQVAILLFKTTLFPTDIVMPMRTVESQSFKATVVSTDMDEELLKVAVETAGHALETLKAEQKAAAAIKKEFDQNHGRTWHCIIGRSFGSFVTHEQCCFAYFYLEGVAVLLFKTP